MAYYTQCQRCLSWINVKFIKKHQDAGCIIGLCMTNTPHLIRELDEKEDTEPSWELPNAHGAWE